MYVNFPFDKPDAPVNKKKAAVEVGYVWYPLQKTFFLDSCV